MIDIHSHLLPGVDDGSRSMEMSVGVLRRFADEGVTVLVCTPHLTASEAASAPVERYRAILAELRAVAPPVPRLELGWEIMLDMPSTDLTDRALGLGGSKAVLVEFPHSGVPPGATEELARLSKSGIVPVLAHPERYWGAAAPLVREWRRVGAVMQVDVAGLLAGGSMGQLSIELLREGLVDCIASDNHGDGQSLAIARRWLEEAGAGDRADLLLALNPGRLLRNESLFPVAPFDPPAMSVGRTMFRHLRDLMRRSRRAGQEQSSTRAGQGPPLQPRSHNNEPAPTKTR
jgi:protein-tyrosine phosphatase